MSPPPRPRAPKKARKRRGIASRLLAITPQLALLGALGWSVAQAPDRDALVERYQRRLTEIARVRESIPEQRVCIGRLADLGARTPALLMHTVALDMHEGHEDRAEETLAFLAPRTGQGYPPAHLARARQLLKEGVADEELDIHLQRATRGGEVTASQAWARLGWYRASGGEVLDDAAIAAAVEALERGQASTKAQLAILLSGYEVLLRRLPPEHERRDAIRAAADQVAKRMLKRSLPILAKNPANDILRAQIARALTLLDRLDDALRLYESRIEELLGKDTPGARRAVDLLRQELCRVLVRALHSGKSSRDRTQLVLDIVEHGRLNPEATRELAALEPLERRRAINRLEALATEGPDQWIALHALGTGLLLADHPDQARPYLQRALQLRPTEPAIGNNLAQILLKQRKPDLEQAHELIDQAIGHAQRAKASEALITRLRDTRAKVRTAQGRYAEALADLMAGLEHVTNKGPTEEAIAAVHEALGNRTLARKYREQAKISQERYERERMREYWGLEE